MNAEIVQIAAAAVRLYAETHPRPAQVNQVQAAALRAKGLDVVNPAEIKPEGEPSWSACMRADLKAMLDCCTVALLPGWEDSKGANIEARLALNLGMRVVELETLMGEL